MNKQAFYRKLLVYILGLIVSFVVVPLLIFVAFFTLLPSARIIAPELILKDKNQFNPRFFENFHKTGAGFDLEGQKHDDHVEFNLNDNIFKLTLFDQNTNTLGIAKILNGRYIEAKERDGFSVTSRSSFQASSGGSFRTEFADGQVCYTRADPGLLIQVISNDKSDPKALIDATGIFVPNPNLSATEQWLSRNSMALFVASLLAFSLLWVVGIFRGGLWVSAVEPRPETPPAPADRVRQLLLEINTHDVPFKIVPVAPNELRAEWKIEGQWAGLASRESLKIESAIHMRLDADKKRVTAIERYREKSKRAGFSGGGWSFSIFRGVSLVQYKSGAVYGLSYVDGQFKMTGYQYTFNIQEMKNPLIEAVTASGWKWEPRVFSL